jgi:hypothetical protein
VRNRDIHYIHSISEPEAPEMVFRGNGEDQGRGWEMFRYSFSFLLFLIRRCTAVIFYCLSQLLTFQCLYHDILQISVTLLECYAGALR